MTKILLSDARLMGLQPVKSWLDRISLSVVWIEQHARKICSHMGVHPDHEIIWTKRRDGIIDPDIRSSLLVREGDGLPLRIDPALPKCPLVSERCAAEMVGGKRS